MVTAELTGKVTELKELKKLSEELAAEIAAVLRFREELIAQPSPEVVILTNLAAASCDGAASLFWSR
jgi:hypothetical protein